MDSVVLLDDILEITNIDISSDIFMVSEHDKYVYDNFNSRHVKCDIFFDGLKNGVLRYSGLGSMAYELISDYLTYEHNHNSLYNKIHTLLFPYGNTSNDNVISVGNLFIDGVIWTVYAPLSCVLNTLIIPKSILEPKIGSLRMLTNKTLLPVDITSLDFDGWVYPDGLTYNANQFVYGDQLKLLYPDPSNTNNFKVPVLNNFIKGYIGSNTSEYITLTNSKTVNEPHAHVVSAKMSGSVGMKVKLLKSSHFGHTRTRKQGDPSATHVSESYTGYILGLKSGEPTMKTGIVVSNPELMMSILSSSINLLTVPDHFVVPIKIYIGGVKS